MKIYAFFEELRRTRRPPDFQKVIMSEFESFYFIKNFVGITKFALHDFVHNCMRIKGSEKNEQENLYLK